MIWSIIYCLVVVYARSFAILLLFMIRNSVMMMSWFFGNVFVNVAAHVGTAKSGVVDGGKAGDYNFWYILLYHLKRCYSIEQIIVTVVISSAVRWLSVCASVCVSVEHNKNGLMIFNLWLINIISNEVYYMIVHLFFFLFWSGL